MREFFVAVVGLLAIGALILIPFVPTILWIFRVDLSLSEP
jgi:hypothetical protein